MASQQSLIYNYASPSEVLAACIVLPLLGILTVGLRFVARLRKSAAIGTDDIFILLALVSFPQEVMKSRALLTSSTTVLRLWYGNNHHLW